MTPKYCERVRYGARTYTRSTATSRSGAPSDEALTNRVRAHGAIVHGFTPVWYSRERVAAITEACTTNVAR